MKIQNMYRNSLVILLSLFLNAGIMAQDMPPPSDDPADTPVMRRGGFKGNPNQMGRNFHHRDPLRAFRFHPEMIMRLQKELDLTDQQKETIKDKIQSAQHKFIDMQFSLQEEMEKLGEILDSENIDNDEALLKLDSVLKMEADIKKTRLALALSIKDELSQEQISQFRELRKQRIAKRKANRGDRGEYRRRGK